MSTADLLAEVQKERDELREALQLFMHLDPLPDDWADARRAGKAALAETEKGDEEEATESPTAKFRVQASELLGGFGATVPLWDLAFLSQEEALRAAKLAAEEKAKESPGRVVCAFGNEGGYFVIETIGDTYMFEVLPVA